jgi:serine protease Do
MAKTLYDILGVGATVSADEAKLRAESLLTQLRNNPKIPDAANQEKFITYAREVLTDPVRRAKYDQSLRERETASAQVHAAMKRYATDAAENVGSGTSASRGARDTRVASSNAPRSLSAFWLGLALALVGGAGGYMLATKRVQAPTAPSVATAPVKTAAAATSPSIPNSKEANAASSTLVSANTAATTANATENAIANPAPETAAPAATLPTAELSAADIFKMNQGSIVVVRGASGASTSLGMSQGSGVVIADEEVVTNCHVARAATDLTVRIGNQSLPARVRYRDQGHDLCQLTVRGLKAPAVALAPVASLAVGSKVYAIGAPQGLELSLSDGVVSSLRAFGGSSLIQTTAAISPGSSGGGLFDSKGQLVGITTFQSRTGQNLNFAVPSDWISTLQLRDGNSDTLLPDSTSLSPRSAIPGALAGVPASAETLLRRRLLVGKWQCHAGAKTANRQIQYEFAADETVTMRGKFVNTDWSTYVSRYRLMSESSLLLEDLIFKSAPVTVRVVEVGSSSAVFEWQLGQSAMHYCSR